MSCNNKSDALKFQKCSQKPLDVHHTMVFRRTIIEGFMTFSLDFLGGKRDYYLAGIGANVLHNGENCMVTTVTRL
jgi:hypothetical protein